MCGSGSYRIVRHPGYAGNIIALTGIVLALVDGTYNPPYSNDGYDNMCYNILQR